MNETMLKILIVAIAIANTILCASLTVAVFQSTAISLAGDIAIVSLIALGWLMVMVVCLVGWNSV